MRSLNKVMLLGTLGKDAEVKFTASGTAILNFSVATSNKWKDKQSGDWKEKTTWHGIKYFGGENLAQFLIKGTQVFIEGEIDNYSYEAQDGSRKYVSEVKASQVILVGSKKDSHNSSQENDPDLVPF